MASARSCGLRDRTDARNVVIFRLLYFRTAGAPALCEARICDRSGVCGVTCAESETVRATAPITAAVQMPIESGRVIVIPESPRVTVEEA